MGTTHLLQLAAAGVDVEGVAHVTHRAAPHHAPAVDEAVGHEVLAAADVQRVRRAAALRVACHQGRVHCARTYTVRERVQGGGGSGVQVGKQ